MNSVCSLRLLTLYNYNSGWYTIVSRLIHKEADVIIILRTDWLFTALRLKRVFYVYGEVSITGKGLQNLCLCLALRAFEQDGNFIVPHLLWHRASVFHSHPKDMPIQSPLTTHKGMLRIDYYQDPHRSRTAACKGSAKWSERKQCCMWGHRRLRTLSALLRKVESELCWMNNYRHWGNCTWTGALVTTACRSCFSVCDTVARCFGVGKRTIIEALRNGVELNKLDIKPENISDIIEEATVSVNVCYGVKR